MCPSSFGRVFAKTAQQVTSLLITTVISVFCFFLLHSSIKLLYNSFWGSTSSNAMPLDVCDMSPICLISNSDKGKSCLHCRSNFILCYSSLAVPWLCFGFCSTHLCMQEVQTAFLRQCSLVKELPTDQIASISKARSFFVLYSNLHIKTYI